MNREEHCTAIMESCLCSLCTLHRLYAAIECHRSDSYYRRKQSDQLLWDRYLAIRYPKEARSEE